MTARREVALKRFDVEIVATSGSPPSQKALIRRPEEPVGGAPGRPQYPVIGSVSVGQRAWCLMDADGAVVVGAPPASETIPGIAEIADSTEGSAGTDNSRIMSPLRVKERIDTRAVRESPFVNLMPDSGRFTSELNPLALYITADNTSTGTLQPFANSTFFTPLNSTTVASGGRFIHNNSDFGGSRGNMTADVLDLLSAQGRTDKLNGAEFYIASYTMGAGTSSALVGTDGITRYLMTANSTRVMFGFANYATASFWIRLKTAGTPGNTVAVKNIVKLYKGGVAQSADVILGVADGWVHITTQLTSTVGYNNAFPHISARSGDVVQIAVPAFFAGEANPGVHKAPLPTAFSPLTHNLFSDRHPDVDASDVPANGEVLSYDSAAGKWKASGFGRNRVTLASDVVNNNAVANTFQDVTGLSFSVVAGTLYKFVAMIAFDAAATTTGSRWSVSGPASPTRLFYIAEWTLTATTTFRSIQSTYNAGTVQATSILSGNLCVIEGIIQPSANGTFVIRFASEVAGSAITAKAGSTLEWW